MSLRPCPECENQLSNGARVAVKGKDQWVDIFEPMGEVNTVKETLKIRAQLYERAFTLYFVLRGVETD